MCVAAARPNFMKVAPVLHALEARGVAVVLVHTGQHYDAAMSDVFFEDLGLRQPDIHLGVGAGTHATQAAGVMVALEPVVDRERPEALIVVGDVNSTVAAALVGAKAGVRVVHVEAGLRSRDWSMPEEVNRVVTDRVSDLLLAPSADAVANLRDEGYRDDQVRLVGNVMIDALLANLERARSRPTLAESGVTPGSYALVTLHRPSNVDDPEVLAGLVGALGRVAERLPVLFPVHPRTAERLDGAGLRLPEGVRRLPSVGYLDFLALEADARLVLTDSGGVQEETTALGVPCVTLRDNTERPITVEQGTNRVVGHRPDAVVAAAEHVLDHGVTPRCPDLWDGRAGERIAEAVIELIGDPGRPHPTDSPAS